MNLDCHVCPVVLFNVKLSSLLSSALNAAGLGCVALRLCALSTSVAAAAVVVFVVVPFLTAKFSSGDHSVSSVQEHHYLSRVSCFAAAPLHQLLGGPWGYWDPRTAKLLRRRRGY